MKSNTLSSSMRAVAEDRPGDVQGLAGWRDIVHAEQPRPTQHRHDVRARRAGDALRRVGHVAELSDEPLPRDADHDRAADGDEPWELAQQGERVLAPLAESDAGI